MTVKILRIHEYFVTTTTTTTTLTLINVTEWLGSLGGIGLSKPIEEMSEEKLTVCLTCFYTLRGKRMARITKVHRSSP